MKSEVTLIIRKHGDRVSVQFAKDNTEPVSLATSLGMLEIAKTVLIEMNRSKEQISITEMESAQVKLKESIPQILENMKKAFAGCPANLPSDSLGVQDGAKRKKGK